MIKEALTYFLTPKSPLAKKFGFIYSSIALQARYERCLQSWLPHLKSCQDLFTASIKDLPQKNSVVILGSSHLHEIPLHLLSDNFKTIILVDIAHPLKHHQIAKKNPRVQLITMDLSGILENLDKLSSLKELQEKILSLQNQELFNFSADLIISANILSQLALSPIDYIEKKEGRKLSVAEKDFLCTEFANLHVKNLLQCTGKKVLYADREVTYRDPQKEIIYKGSYRVDFLNMEKTHEWIWLIAPLKEASKDYSIEMTIKAYQG